MGKKRKGRCVRNNIQVRNQESEELLSAPHSFVIHRGIPGGHINELTKDFRKVMEPYTASSLKERKKNTIKDFVSIAGPLHVSHMCIFSRTEHGVYFKLARIPRGPTLTFKVHNFSLARDIVSSLKKQLVFNEAYKHSPLIVLNNFSGEGMHMKLMAQMFQNMFPSINLRNVNLSNIHRCVLLNYNAETKLIDFRHYVIKVVPVGISKGVKKVVQGKVPNLASCGDISEFLTKAGMLSESEAEDDVNSHVTLAQKLSSRGNMESGKSAIRLSELGPRITLQLVKIEDGMMDGEVLYHELIHKTEEEKEAIKKKREEKKKKKEKSKKLQEDNKKKKDAKKQELREKSLKGMKRTESAVLMQRAARESANAMEQMQEDDNDANYYREEVGEDPDKDLFSSTRKTGMFHKQSTKYKNTKGNTDTSFDKQWKQNKKNKNERRDNRPTKKFNKNNQNSGFKNKKDGKFASRKSSLHKVKSGRVSRKR